MRILLISVNRETSPFAVAPIGAVHLIPPLEAAGHTVDFLDLCFARRPVRRATRTARKLNPQLIGVSIRNLDNCMYGTPRSYYEAVRTLIDALKRVSDAPIIIGGGGVSVLPQPLMNYLDVPYALVGEGEHGFTALVNGLEARRSVDRIPGLLVRRNDGIRFQPPEFSLNVDQLPLYAVDRIDYRRYFRRGGFIGYQTKRGCAFGCIYCNYRTLEGAAVRRRSPEQCAADIERLAAVTGRTDFFFTDSVFNWPRDHAAAICEEIIRRGVNIRWMAYCNPSGLDHEMARLFKASGCAGVELGLDAVTDDMLENMGKGFSRQDIARTYRALTRAEIPFAVFLLFGGPGDTFDNLATTQRLLSEFGKANAVFASLGIRIYPDAPIYATAVAEGVLTGTEDLLSPTYYLSPGLAPDGVGRLDRLARKDATWSTPTDWNSPLVSVIQQVLGRMRVIPNWRDIENYGKFLRRS